MSRWVRPQERRVAELPLGFSHPRSVEVVVPRLKPRRSRQRCRCGKGAPGRAAPRSRGADHKLVAGAVQSACRAPITRLVGVGEHEEPESSGGHSGRRAGEGGHRRSTLVSGFST